jgi:GntP family gluconate:H+ symporter
MSTKPDQACWTSSPSPQKPPASRPSVALGVLAALLPAILMLVHAVAEMLLPKDSAALHVASFLGNPLIAMLLGVLFAIVALVLARGGDMESCATRWARASSRLPPSS